MTGNLNGLKYRSSKTNEQNVKPALYYFMSVVANSSILARLLVLRDSLSQLCQTYEKKTTAIYENKKLLFDVSSKL